MEDERLPIRKIVIDSRHRTTGTPSDFLVQLPETLTITKHFGCIVTDVSCSHSFRTVHGNSSVGAKNHYLYFFERLVASFYPSENAFIVLNRATLNPGSYSPEGLCTELQTQMRAVSFFGNTAYTVQYSDLTHTATITLSYAGHATFGNYHGFLPVNARSLQDGPLQAYAQSHRLTNTNGLAYPASIQASYILSPSTPESADELFGVHANEDPGFRAVATLVTMNSTDISTEMAKSYISGEIDVRHVHTLFLRSNALSNFSAIGPSGSRSVLARLPVANLQGGVLFKQHSGNIHDVQDVSGKMLSILDFSVRNSKNEIVDLHSGSLSCEFVFAPLPMNEKSKNVLKLTPGFNNKKAYPELIRSLSGAYPKLTPKLTPKIVKQINSN